MSMIVGLIVATLLLVAIEIVLPGGVLGVVAVVCLIAATALTYQDYGVFSAAFVFLGTVVAALFFSIIQFRYLVKTPLGRKLFLSKTVEGHSNVEQTSDDLIGSSGQALTRLNPTGMVLIDGQKFEAHSEDGFIEQNQSVRVVARDNFKLIIQKS